MCASKSSLCATQAITMASNPTPAMGLIAARILPRRVFSLELPQRVEDRLRGMVGVAFGPRRRAFDRSLQVARVLFHVPGAQDRVATQAIVALGAVAQDEAGVVEGRRLFLG